MEHRSRFLALLVLAALLCGSASAEPCVRYLTTAAEGICDFRFPISDWVEQSAIGNRQSASEVGQFSWPNVSPVGFALGYSTGLEEVEFVVDGQTLTLDPSNGFSDVVIRTQAADVAVGASAGRLLVGSRAAGDGSIASSPQGGVDILWIGLAHGLKAAQRENGTTSAFAGGGAP